jgi:hypothetical protein
VFSGGLTRNPSRQGLKILQSGRIAVGAAGHRTFDSAGKMTDTGVFGAAFGYKSPFARFDKPGNVGIEIFIFAVPHSSPFLGVKCVFSDGLSQTV